MALSEIDRKLLDRCLDRKPRAWEDFVDRYMGLVMHVINHSAQARSIRLAPEDREDLCAEVFLAVIKDDFAVLRRFRGQASLATYLTVIARRVVVKELLANKSAARLATVTVQPSGVTVESATAAEDRLYNRDEVERLLEDLEGYEAQVVRLYHIEGKSYREISSATGMPENSVGPTLSRAREKMRRAGGEATA
ncbi:MAG: sigma-70 family RNA polymerase sigma factor [Planctomycetia bacterium]|nr:sigma-70 family RNA polymerase sigma factor [Planctomycetia bacterium]